MISGTEINCNINQYVCISNPYIYETSILSHYTPYTIFTAIMIVLSFVVISKLFWMLIYEIKYYKGAGMDYLKYGKEITKNRYFYISHGVMSIEDYEEK